jgi:hypothetical protein
MTSTWEFPVELVQVIDPPLGTSTGLGLNAPLPAELTMLTVLAVLPVPPIVPVVPVLLV